jgi:hypothetical protein
MTPDIYAQRRNSLREVCASLRKLLASERPIGMVATLQEVGNIECDALVSTGIEFQAVRESMRILLKRLRNEGIISSEEWEEFLGQLG